MPTIPSAIDWTENEELMHSMLTWVTGRKVCAQDGAIYLPLELRSGS